ncbi:MAG: HNH endonuclease [Elusimicrobia bacterium]|nr:HNH endonuclease [Elusimicrobiota bacterium]
MGKIEALAETERFSMVDFLLHLGELDERKACERTAYGTPFGFLTRRLGLSESEAVRRVRVARAAKKYPSILRLLAAGELNLLGVAILEPVLTSANHEMLLRRATRRSTREIDRMAAELGPAAPPPREYIRALPEPRRASETADAAAPPPPVMSSSDGILGDLFSTRTHSETAGPAPSGEPEEPHRVVFNFTADEQMRERFEEARDLLRHRFPAGRMEEVLGEALRRLVEVEREKLTSKRSPRKTDSPPSRRVPKRVRDEVWRRDGGRCSYAGTDGIICGATGWLEFDHVTPWAKGGKSDDPANIRLLCRIHNAAEARREFGSGSI